jgi:hypothetical protein
MTIKKKRKFALNSLALAGLVAGLSACNESPAKNYSKDEATSFREECKEAGGTLKELSCDGTSTCAGIMLDGESGEVVETTCKGTNKCAGIQCLDANPMGSSSSQQATSSSMVTDSRAALLSAKTAQEFTDACSDAGKTVETQSTCAGHNSCAGIYFNEAESSSAEHSCSGTSSCKGLKCSA